LLAARATRQKAFDAGATPNFLPETQAIRDGDWKVAPIPPTSPTAASRSPPRRPQDDRQRAELRRESVHGGFRGRHLAGLRNMIEGQAT